MARSSLQEVTGSNREVKVTGCATGIPDAVIKSRLGITSEKL